MKVRGLLALICAAGLAACGHESKPQETAKTQAAQPAPRQPAQPESAPLADATPSAEQPNLPEAVGETAPAPAKAPAVHRRAARRRKPSAMPKAAAPESAGVEIPAGAIVRVRLARTVSTRRSHSGDRFQALLVTPIVVEGRTIVPRGTTFEGHVVIARPSGHFQGRAVLSLALDSFWLHGVRHRVNTTLESTQSSTKKHAWAFATGRKEVTLAAQTPLTFRLRRNVALKRG